jgi:hypothetical protein
MPRRTRTGLLGRALPLDPRQRDAQPIDGSGSTQVSFWRDRSLEVQ